MLFPPCVLRPRWKTQLKITCLMWIMENHYSWATEIWHREVHCTVTNQTWIHPPSPLKTQHNPTTTSPTLYGPTARWWMRWVQYMADGTYYIKCFLTLLCQRFSYNERLQTQVLYHWNKHNSQVGSSVHQCILQNALSSAACGKLDHVYFIRKKYTALWHNLKD